MLEDDIDEIQYEKKQLRKSIIQKRDSMDTSLRRNMNNRIFDRLVKSDFYKASTVIFTFVSFGSEVDTHEFIEFAIADGKTICVPRIKSKKIGIELYKIESMKELTAGYFGILEPVESCSPISREKVNLIIMPGVAFDRSGGRIGYGGGFYDKYLTGLSQEIVKIAIAYSIQIIERIKTTELDINVDYIITEEELINCKNTCQ